MRIIFAGTPNFAAPPLKALLQEHEVVAVYTQPDRKAGRGKKLTAPPIKEIALSHNIPVFQPLSFSDEAQRIAELNADVMVVVAYGMLLPKSVLSLPRYGCINIHASLLPRWRGAAPIQRSIEAGDKETGVSIMKMAAGLDTGDVYQTLSLDISAHDTSASLHDKLAHLGAMGICQTLASLDADPNLVAVEQNHELANYAKKITKSEAQIDWTESATQIDARARAFIPWPVSQTHLGETRIRIWQAEPSTTASNAIPGTILNASALGIQVSCGTGSLIIKKLQKDGGKPLPAQEFLNGLSINKGDFFSHIKPTQQ